MKEELSEQSNTLDNTREESSHELSGISESQVALNQRPNIACGSCYNCYIEIATNGILDPTSCQLTQLVHSNADTTETSNDESLIHVFRMTQKSEREARTKHQLSRLVTTKSELTLRCEACYKAGWRPIHGRSYGQTVFFYSLDGFDASKKQNSESEFESHIELKFKAITFVPSCRICGKHDQIKTNFDELTKEKLINAFAKRLIKLIASRQSRPETTQSTIDEIDSDDSEDSQKVIT